MRNINAAILIVGWMEANTHSGDDMAEEESGRFLDFKRKMEEFWDHQIQREIFDNSNQFLNISGITSHERAWGLYYRALGQYHLDDAEDQNIKLDRCLNDINEAIELKNLEPDFYILRAKIYKRRGSLNEANSDSKHAINIIHDPLTDKSKVTPEKLLEYYTTRAEVLIVVSLPKDIYEDVLFHSEVLIFNVPKLKGHYFYDGQF